MKIDSGLGPRPCHGAGHGEILGGLKMERRRKSHTELARRIVELLRVEGAELAGVEVPTEHVPGLIDEIPALAVAAGHRARPRVPPSREGQEEHCDESVMIGNLYRELTFIVRMVIIAKDSLSL